MTLAILVERYAATTLELSYVPPLCRICIPPALPAASRFAYLTFARRWNKWLAVPNERTVWS